METQIFLNNFPKNNISVATFLISVKNALYTILLVAMVTKFNNLSRLHDFIAMETQIVLSNFPKKHISVTTFLIGFKNDLYTNLLLAMVTKFNNISYCTILLPWNKFTNLLMLLPPFLLG